MAPQNARTGPDPSAGLSQSALRALSAAGFARLDQLSAVDESALLKLQGVGPRAAANLRAALEARGLSISEPDSQDAVR
jgi:hypothetical protein